MVLLPASRGGNKTHLSAAQASKCPTSHGSAQAGSHAPFCSESAPTAPFSVTPTIVAASFSSSTMALPLPLAEAAPFCTTAVPFLL